MKVSVYVAISSNGFISNRRDVPDWLSPEFGRGFMEICQTTKAVIMGKKTYDFLAPGNLPLTDEGISVVLTSHTDAAPANPTVSFTNDSPAEIVALLEEKGVPEAVIIGARR